MRPPLLCIHLEGDRVRRFKSAQYDGRRVTVRTVDPGEAKHGQRRTACLASQADSEYQKLLWDAALESMGRVTVRIRLNNMPADRSAAFKLPGQRSYKREYAEDWLGRGDAKEKALEARQHRDAFWITALTAALGIVAAVAAVVTAWPVMRDWIK